MTSKTVPSSGRVRASNLLAGGVRDGAGPRQLIRFPWVRSDRWAGCVTPRTRPTSWADVATQNARGAGASRVGRRHRGHGHAPDGVDAAQVHIGVVRQRVGDGRVVDAGSSSSGWIPVLSRPALGWAISGPDARLRCWCPRSDRLPGRRTAPPRPHPLGPAGPSIGSPGPRSVRKRRPG